ncbi:arabinogalactan endo-1,4-beta-galactosidase [Paenibacillus pasadenensis]|uniref:Arabinogalactan endo-beta-1,4-galactanase n=2 Tax=Paenibacillus TaxID=44249 RepID=A0A2N5N322_9BACL|nr:arabinogalactan endo-1,4-beta-galactosidase [Paenibacillus pasadenensis]
MNRLGQSGQRQEEAHETPLGGQLQETPARLGEKHERPGSGRQAWKRRWKQTAAILMAALLLLLAPAWEGAGAGVGGKAEAAPAFAKGADISWVAAMEAQGYKWKDKNGVTRDIFNILKNDYGLNSARIRVWVNPNMSDYGNGYLNADKAAELAARAKAQGMSVMLSLHYSDSWADPGKQTKPYAWTGFTFNQLMDAVWSHTVYVMNTMKAKGVTPDWVQIGNETNDGMLWQDGRASVNMKNYAWLVNTGNNAVKSIFPSTKTIVHLANGYDNALFVWNIGGLIANGATFDYIGMSLYPSVSDWQTKVTQTVANANDMIARYGKSVMICEIGLDYNQPAASKSFIADIKTKIRNISGGKGLGVFYWEPQSTPGYNGGYNKGAWQADGKPTIALDGFLN